MRQPKRFGEESGMNRYNVVLGEVVKPREMTWAAKAPAQYYEVTTPFPMVVATFVLCMN
jgi:hypothetical protein